MTCPNCERLQARIRELEAQVARTSETSHQPPSQDQAWKQKQKSERLSGIRSSGGQIGHPGTTLKMSPSPDEVVMLPVTGSCRCGQHWHEVEVHDLLARQVLDLPEVQLHVTEYQAEVKVCPRCHQRQQAAFPGEVRGQVQYGPRFQGLAVYLNVAQFLPFKRVGDVLETLCGQRPSEGTIALHLNLATERLAGFEASLKEALLEEPVLHVDETGSKVKGKLAWVHVISSKQLTLYGHDPHRGSAAIQALGVLPRYGGVLMHDAWLSYFHLCARHALCNAHLLRELRFLHEQLHQDWAGELRTALQGVYHQHKTGTLTPVEQAAFLVRFDTLVEAGLVSNPAAEPVPKHRGRVKQSPGRNLALRCQKHRDKVLRFLYEEGVPFDNNQAERDLRMVCVKRKISGGFRSATGGKNFCRIRSYLSTLQKQGLSIYTGLVSIFQNQILLPHLSSSC
ncbi:IS66 family transposase [Deinococcus hopiensis]|uniref:Transposase n=1 Tax=Deinococcus hopiensis KR-140 TaxID=695939 RepID=A0A1W1UAD5_9DEIO|nr:IS66 family transposase [Deinococcus hopiensis]SMB78068.1 transposase [Deinococcus hopiensis KR-140]